LARGSTDKSWGMSDSDPADFCYICRKGHFVRHDREVAFHQSTDKGYVFCRVVVPIGICNQCGSQNWDEAAEAIIEAAVRDEYDKLPD